jgi:hypothetical protein
MQRGNLFASAVEKTRDWKKLRCLSQSESVANAEEVFVKFDAGRKLRALVRFVNIRTPSINTEGGGHCRGAQR